MFKFSLRLCIWLVLLVGSVLGLVLDREPWVLENRVYTRAEIIPMIYKPNSDPKEPLQKIRDHGEQYKSPDGTRYRGQEDRHDVRPAYIYENEFIADSHTHVSLFDLDSPAKEFIAFIDDNTILVYSTDWKSKDRYKNHLMHRRFPEWWWGIFYRPLFWIAVIVFFGTIFEFVTMRKRLRTG